MGNRKRKASPRPVIICLLCPQPPNLKSATNKIKIMNPEPTIFKRPLNLFPIYQAIATIGLLVALPQETFPLFINGFYHPFREVQGK